MKLLWF